MFDRFIQAARPLFGGAPGAFLIEKSQPMPSPGSRSCCRTVISAVLTVALVPVVNAAVLGEMNISSARGEHLHAEIAVDDVKASETASLSVSIADAALSSAAGLVQSENLPYLWAELRQRGDDSWYVQLLSSEPVSDPYNEIIVELVWDGGSYLREYALRFGGSTRVEEKQLPLTAASSAPEVNETIAPTSTNPAVTAGSVNPQLIPVSRGDNLLQIVRGLQLAPNVSPEQAMWGIYTANTGSFSGSPDQLLAGVTLQIPSMQVLAQLSQQAAIAGLKQPAANPIAVQQVEVEADSPAAQQVVTTVSLRNPSIPLYQEGAEPISSAAGAGANANAEEIEDTANLSLTRVVNTDSVSGVFTRQASQSRVEQTLEQLNASLADVKANISGVEDSVSSLSDNLGNNVGKVQELSSLITQLNNNQAPATDNEALTTGDLASANANISGSVSALATTTDAVAPVAEQISETNRQTSSRWSHYVQLFMDSTYFRSLVLLSLGLLLALLLVTKQLLAQRRKTRLLSADQLAKDSSSSETNASQNGSGKVYSAKSIASAKDQPGGPSVLRMQEEVVDAPTALSWFREHLRSGRVSELDLVRALRRYPNRQDLRLRLMERYANRQEVESFAQLAREMFQLTRGRNKEWPRAIQIGLALELEMEAMEPHMARPYEPIDFGIERDIETPYAGDSTLQFADRRQRTSRKSRNKPAGENLQPDVTLDKTIAI